MKDNRRRVHTVWSHLYKTPENKKYSLWPKSEQWFHGGEGAVVGKGRWFGETDYKEGGSF